jgi:hypothetical protein
MPFTYAIADLHGRYDLLSEAVTKIVEHSKSDRPATVITLGDYVDRGPTSRQVIERLMDWGSPDPKMKARFSELGVVPAPMSPADFGKMIADETEKWGKVVKFVGIKPE